MGAGFADGRDLRAPPPQVAWYLSVLDGIGPVERGLGRLTQVLASYVGPLDQDVDQQRLPCLRCRPRGPPLRPSWPSGGFRGSNLCTGIKSRFPERPLVNTETSALPIEKGTE